MDTCKKSIVFLVIIALVVFSNAWMIPGDIGAQPVLNHWNDEGNYDISWYEGNESDSSYVLSTAAQLAGIAYLMYQTDSDLVNFSGKTITLANDIDLSANYWLPIGRVYDILLDNPPYSMTVRHGFAGTFDGCGYTISGLRIDQAANQSLDLDTRGIGFFGLVTEGQVKNLNLEDVQISGGASSTGGLVGLLLPMTQKGDSVNRCSVTGSVTNTSSYPVGGLIGEVMGSVSQSYAQSAVTNSDTAGYAGGLVGRISSGDISECYAAGIVSGMAPESGGLVGYYASDTSSITSSYYDQDLAGTDLVGEGLPRTTLEMKAQATFVDWDFDAVWSIEEGQSYPFFKPSDEQTDDDSSGHPSQKAPAPPGKLEPLTILAPGQPIALTTDLRYFVAIPEQWMADTTKVEFWLEAVPVTAGVEGFAYIQQARVNLQTIPKSLLDTYQVDLMQRVTKKDGTVTESIVAQEAVRGNFTVRLPIPPALQSTPNLGIVYIEETGLIANLDSNSVVMDGMSYIEFANNQTSAVYGFVSNPA